MPVLRQHTVLLDVTTPLTEPVVGTAFRFTPSDGDAIPDAAQELVALVTLGRKTADGAVRLTVEGSFDGTHWVRLAQATLRASDLRLERVVPLGPVPPLLRASVAAAKATDSAVAVYVAVGSSAPYRARAVA